MKKKKYCFIFIALLLLIFLNVLYFVYSDNNNYIYSNIIFLIISFVLFFTIIINFRINNKQNKEIEIKSKYRESVILHSKLIETLPDGLIITDKDSKITFLSDKVYELFAIKKEIEVKATDFREWILPEDSEKWLKNQKKILSEHKLIHSEYYMERFDGSRFWVEIRSTSLKDDSGNVKYILNIITDITERKAIEKQLFNKLYYEKAVTTVSKELLNFLNSENALTKSLETLLKSTKCSRVYILKYKVEENNTIYEKLDEVCEKDVPAFTNNIFESKISNWTRTLKMRNIVTGLTKNFSPSEKQFLETQGIVSILMVPIFINKNFFGFLGFNDNNTPKEWSKEEIDAIKLAADAIGSHITAVYAENKMQKAKVEAETANKSKSFFLATLSHEIKSPISSIMGFADLLISQINSEEQKEFLNYIKNSSETVLFLINEILNFSKIESGNLELERIMFQFHNLVHEIFKSTEILAVKKELKMELIIEDNVPKYIYGDKVRLKQIMTNIINNALKFTSEGKISVKIFSEEIEKKIDNQTLHKIYFEVADTGIGIPDNALERLFTPFQQTDSSITRRFGGTGLGLPISKKLCELMGGEIRVSSEENKGSVFTCSFLAETEN
jgi:PAS domain S-box-containing protein